MAITRIVASLSLLVFVTLLCLAIPTVAADKVFEYFHNETPGGTGATSSQGGQPGNFSVLFAGGNGSLNNPYQIANCVQLQNMSASLTASYALANDIDCINTSNGTLPWDEYGFDPVGDNSTPFTGTFNGNNLTISNLFINRSSELRIGLFGRILGATLQNVGLLNINITGNSYTGGLAGEAREYSAINNSNSAGAVSGSSYVGGLVGYSYIYSAIDNSYANGSVSGDNYVGGLAGMNWDATISDSYATGSVSGGDDSAGGLVGWNYDSTINNSYSTGTVSGDYHVGGLAGENGGDSTIDNSYATGNVDCSSYSCGGLVGLNHYSTINNSYAIGNVSGNDHIGGLVGYHFYGTIDNSYATGSVTGDSSVGGLVGDNRDTISNSYWLAQFGISNCYDGGDDGCTMETNVTYFYNVSNPPMNYSNITWYFPPWDDYCNSTGFPPLAWQNLTDPSQCVQGVQLSLYCPVGMLGNNTLESPCMITDCEQLQAMNQGLSGYYALNNSIDCINTSLGISPWNASGFDPVGDWDDPFTGSFNGNNNTISNLFINRSEENYVGLFGYMSGSDITNVGLESITISGSVNVGGLAGSNYYDSTIDNSYVTGIISGTSQVGGLIGRNYQSRSVDNSYSASTVSGDNQVGGLVGDNAAHSTIDNSYATGSVNGTTSVGGLVGLNNGGIVNNSYSAGSVSGDNNVGGLVGYNPGTIINSFWLAQFGISNCYDGGDDGCTRITNVTYFYNVENMPMNKSSLAYWLFPPWDDYCNTTGFPVLAWQNLTDPGECPQGVQLPLCPAGMAGGGTPEDPCMITNCTQLQAMSDDMSTSYVLANDIDCINTSLSGQSIWGAEGFDPVGEDSNPFTGSFNGNNNTISNLFINRSAEDCIGLFGYTDGSDISNVGLENVSVSGDEKVGGLVSCNNQYSTINNSYSTGSVSGDNNVGGLVGYNAYHSTIDNSYSAGTVTGGEDSRAIGGLVGYNYRYSTIDNSYATGTVSGSSYVGGLVGYNRYSTIDNSYAAGNVNCSSYDCGGLVGYSGDSAIDNSYATGNVNCSSYDVGGLVGYNNQYSTIDNSYSTGSVSGDNNVGGLVGRSYSAGAISNSYWFDWSGDNATDCYSNSPYNDGCVRKNSTDGGITYFYEVENPPMNYTMQGTENESWLFPPWDDICNNLNYPPLAWQGIENIGQCPGYIPACSDGFCSSDENRSTCSEDCAVCDDGFCDPSETCSTCPDDCGSCEEGPGGGNAPGASGGYAFSEPNVCGKPWDCTNWGPCINGAQSRFCSCPCFTSSCTGDGNTTRACENPPGENPPGENLPGKNPLGENPPVSGQGETPPRDLGSQIGKALSDIVNFITGDYIRLSLFAAGGILAAFLIWYLRRR